MIDRRLGSAYVQALQRLLCRVFVSSCIRRIYRMPSRQFQQSTSSSSHLQITWPVCSSTSALEDRWFLEAFQKSSWFVH